MGFLDKLFGGKQLVAEKVAADRARGSGLSGSPVLQTAEEQAGVRQRMEAELDAQRQQRVKPSAPEA